MSIMLPQLFISVLLGIFLTGCDSAGLEKPGPYGYEEAAVVNGWTDETTTDATENTDLLLPAETELEPAVNNSESPIRPDMEEMVPEEEEEPPVMANTESSPPLSVISDMPYPMTDFKTTYGEGDSLPNTKMSWYFNRNSDGVPPSAQRDFDIRPFGGYYLGDTSQPVVYLTFDEGYENGYSSLILDVLKEKDVQAAFFVTKSYIKQNPELITRMVEEGHIVGNHSVTHPSMPDLSDEDVLYEIKETEKYFKEITGHEIGRYFRPPMGEYSARTLRLAQQAGYKSVFWSFAYRDWLVDDQPGAKAAYDTIINNTHNGCIYLLHAVSSSNTEALPQVIDTLKDRGYTFLTLDDLPTYQ